MLRRPAVGRRGPGLVGTMARTAVVAGTATATANAVSNRQAGRQQAAEDQAQQQATYDQQQQMAAMQQQQASAPAGPPDLATKLKQLADLNAAGALSDAEFAAAKAKLLGG
jgi:hypothetical protein